ncbi:hypothetical protein HGRIS_014958 [Hohenbuehelia grisea]|uniref:Uncharacterized protein n=1 Tax=Hohenbuehelia grisea TaxID=104357 RepID=A0ABR3IZL1_9AGAR
MARNKRRRESDEASSPHTSDSATDDITLESPHTPDAATTDEATLESPHTPDAVTGEIDEITLESPHIPDAATIDEATLESLLPKIRSWLDHPDNVSLVQNLTVLPIPVKKARFDEWQTLLTGMVKDAPKEICDLVLGPEGNRVLTNTEDLQKLKGLDIEVILVKMWADRKHHFKRFITLFLPITRRPI